MKQNCVLDLQVVDCFPYLLSWARIFRCISYNVQWIVSQFFYLCICVFAVNLYRLFVLFVCSWCLMSNIMPDNRKPCSNSCWLDQRNHQRMGGCCCSTRNSHLNGTPAYYYVSSFAFPHDHGPLFHLFSLPKLRSIIFIPFCSAPWLLRSVSHPKFVVAQPQCSWIQDMIWTWICRYRTLTDPLPHLSRMMWFWNIHNRKISALLKKQSVDVVLNQQWKVLGNWIVSPKTALCLVALQGNWNIPSRRVMRRLRLSKKRMSVPFVLKVSWNGIYSNWYSFNIIFFSLTPVLVYF